MAIRQEGTAKGTQCKFPAGENGYCGRHQRNKLYDAGIAEEKLWCRFFFRGCSNTVHTSGIACSDCKIAARADKPQCSHEGCTRIAKQEEKYCGKHVRDKYRDQEKESGICYCDINRGCFNICEEGHSSCPSCLEKARESDNKRYATRKEIHNVINIVHKSQPPQQLCCYCGKDFLPFTTKHDKSSQACPSCNDSHAKQEAKRFDRVINYPQRRANHSDTHYAQYIRSAKNRGIAFELSSEEFKSIVCQSCFYCGTVTAGESVGIDRFDNTKGYTVENCRPCCDTCNRMKWTFHPLFFIEKCKILAGKPSPPDFFQTWVSYYTRPNPIYSQYKYDALKRGYAFSITREEFELIIMKPCYMCNYEGITGIDRKDNNVGYTLTNCMSCCYSCNMSKADIDYSKVIQTSHMVAENWDNTSSITLPVPIKELVVLKPGKKKIKSIKCIDISERKGWKAASLYTYLKGAQYNEIMETLTGVKSVNELKELHANIEAATYEESIIILKKFMNTVRIRRTRAVNVTPDTITHA